ncbi:unnamed protein product [Phyllotreta striolata]|uniref:26S proteasome non-ATPase regulatory subunit 10 n=1 Tax=Phyllotreta striolata TaxID=444603 RepID=A0A9N9TM54_PHYSR|nr:unnamed protein product [Phyllotreta striolata]
MAKDTIYDAAHKGDYDFLTQKIQGDPDLIETPDSSKRLLIHWAVLSGNYKLVHHLIECGSPVNPEDDCSNTPLLLACSAGHLEIVKLLLKKCKDIDHRNAQGHSGLQYAASKGWTSICALLLEEGADVNIADERGSTPLHRAASKGLAQVVDLLLGRKGALRVDSKDLYGNTALHYACEEDRQEVAVALVKNGADMEMKNKEGRTCLDLCSPRLNRVLISTISK